ncbi:MAG TPA: type II toxin-antitoxin system HicA family toxin [Gallionellaceae bacterium]|nr:type II toxin-antitoxin system HicA family toxin [Gallionellaceae bacterium]
MSHKHDSQLSAIFHDPVSGNIHWREVESLLQHLGASINPAHGARFHVTLNSLECFLHHPHQSSVCDRNLIKHLREFLIRAGVKPPAESGRA